MHCIISCVSVALILVHLVVTFLDNTNHKFWVDYFFVKTEHVVANPAGFPEAWNFARKYFVELIVCWLILVT